MRQLKVPVLAIAGSKDAFLANAKDAASFLSNAKVVEIPGATHAGATGALYRPEFIGAIREFLSEHAHPMPEDHYFESNGVTIRYTDQGSGAVKNNWSRRT
jgi:hypothetical protein